MILTLLLRAGGLTIVYLLVLTSAAPGDVVVGGVLGLAAALLFRTGPIPPAPRATSVLAFVRMVAETGREMVVGSWRVVRFCLGDAMAPGFVEIPRDGRSAPSVALWGVLTGEAPDEVPVEVDDARDVLIVHLVDARDADAVRERHRHLRERTLRHVVS